MHKGRWVFGLLSGLLLWGKAGAAHAEGFELGARVGYGVPLGKASGESGDDNNLSDGITGMIPLQLDVGYRVIPPLMIGGYVMYGFGFAGKTATNLCDRIESAGGSATCSAHDVRVGVQAQYHFQPAEKTDPWLGAGIGYEWFTVGFNGSAAGGSADVSTTGHGWEFIDLQGGVDFSWRPTSRSARSCHSPWVSTARSRLRVQAIRARVSTRRVRTSPRRRFTSG